MTHRRTPLLLAALLGMAAWASGPGGLEAQDAALITGRVLDRDTGAPVADAVVLLDESGLGAVTTASGLFELSGVPPGSWTVRVRHIAYGAFADTLQVRESTRVALRIVLSPEAIELDPVVVEVESREAYLDRARGTASNVVTRDEIERSFGTAQTLGNVLQRNVTGVVIRAPQTRPGSMMCLEFRQPRSLNDPLSCKSPTVFVDGVRITNPRPLWTTFPIEDIQRMEVVPSVEAGARYGTDSNYGVLLIETRTGGNVLGEDDDLVARPGGAYDWSLESEPYPWLRVFATSFVGNAVGLGLGVLAGSQCYSFDGLSETVFNSSCGGLATAGVTTVLFGAPVAGASLGAHWAGATDLSRGRWLPAAVGAALALVPGYILVAAGDAEAFAGAEAIGWISLTVGVPAFSTIADRLFRKVSRNPLAVPTR